MKLTILTAVFCATLLFSDIRAEAQIPPGSYQATCEYISVGGPDLTARCRKKDGIFGNASLTDFFLCDGDIANLNGQLSCAKNPGSALMEKAKASIAEAYMRSYATELKEYEKIGWVRNMFMLRPEYVMKFFYKGMTGIEAMQYFRVYIREPGQAKDRLKIIRTAFGNVYGREPGPAEVAYWDGECNKVANFYETIVIQETVKLNSNKITRRFMTTAAYKRSFGRPASSSELIYWESKTETSQRLIEANRKYLYSPQGAKELAATVERALYNELGEKPSAKQINERIVKYRATKALFEDMK